ncbi:DUF427 domain-containing protein [Xanthovirga aplysinae]|uniref:DUF427 domain-containing protein n=1 Tax=Xanthovirga aplysinae TaxID=2529853 RepID=UPI0012BC8102|nr:DUF427 domain-containing protein [Xanthovirga aplysinae]MTI31945.1 DUF427 domain-containing protein [Xanthovirga aplysinae]
MENIEKRHYAVIDPYQRKLTLKYNDQIIAESTHALILKEVAKTVYDPVFYIPKEDVKVELEKEAGRHSACPIKGDATYWNLKTQPTSDYFAWSYEEPLPRTKKIESLIAFNPAYISFLSEPLS